MSRRVVATLAILCASAGPGCVMQAQGGYVQAIDGDRRGGEGLVGGGFHLEDGGAALNLTAQVGGRGLGDGGFAIVSSSTEAAISIIEARWLEPWAFVRLRGDILRLGVDREEFTIGMAPRLESGVLIGFRDVDDDEMLALRLGGAIEYDGRFTTAHRSQWYWAGLVALEFWIDPSFSFGR